MKYTPFDQMNCSLAQTLTVIGERWTLLILREAFFGTKKFSQFQQRLGIARNILSSRLNQLVAEDILLKRSKVEGGHADYVLTEKGLALQPILLAMTHWGDQYKPHPDGARLEFIERDTGIGIRRMSAVSQDGRSLAPRDIKTVLGPALAGADNKLQYHRESE